MIKADIFQESMIEAQRIFEISRNLREIGTKVDYVERDEYLQSLVGEQGYVTFHPEVTDELKSKFVKANEEDHNVIHRYYGGIPWSHPDNDLAQAKLNISVSIRSSLTEDDLLNNTVPARVAKEIKQYTMAGRAEVVKMAKSMLSPKLSKLLVKLYGEDSETVKWYTNKCPKSLSKGVLDNWKLTLSTLPHHIAGMSYYSSYNHGGDKWMEGYMGTSCMDTLRNSKGQGVYQLLPSLKDVTMAVAYLSYAHDNDVMSPVFQARCLVRVVNIYGTYHMLACRPYSISNEATHILYSGLQNKFPNVHIISDMVDYNPFRYETFEVKLPESIRYEVEGEVTCPTCDGTGNDPDYDNSSCSDCDNGTRYHEGSYLPYIDDSEIIRVRDETITFRIPTAYLEHIGVSEEVEQENAVDSMSQVEAYAAVMGAN